MSCLSILYLFRTSLKLMGTKTRQNSGSLLLIFSPHFKPFFNFQCISNYRHSSACVLLPSFGIGLYNYPLISSKGIKHIRLPSISSVMVMHNTWSTTLFMQEMCQSMCILWHRCNNFFNVLSSNIHPYMNYPIWCAHY